MCTCVKDESWYPQISDLYACLNKNRGDIGQCSVQQQAFDKAFMEDAKVQVGTSFRWQCSVMLTPRVEQRLL